MTAQANAYVDGAERSGMSGTVLLARDGEVLLRRGFGFADRESRVRAGPDTVFTVASLTKQFVAVAIFSLQEEGRLRVDDPLQRFFPTIPDRFASITIRQVMAHSAGLEDLLGTDFEEVDREEFLRRFYASDLLWAPGTRYRYSNAGYTLLALLIERVTDTPFEDYLVDELFLPTGMRFTGYVRPDWSTRTLAVGYSGFGDQDRWGTIIGDRWSADGPNWILSGSGGIHSDLDDLYRWMSALSGGRIISPQSVSAMLAPQVDVGSPEGSVTEGASYAAGWMVRETSRGTREVMHSGGAHAFKSFIRWWPDEDLVLITLINNSGIHMGRFNMGRFNAGIAGLLSR